MEIRFATTALMAFMAVGIAHAAPRKPAARPAPPPVVQPLPDTVRVAMATEMGTITLDLDGKHAPVSTRNFLRYVDGKRFDGIVFYRVMRLAWGEQPNGLIQAGLRGDPKRVLPPIAHENTAQTGLKHVAGAISMARLGVGTATADFSILISDIPGLDAGQNPNDPEGYAVFGRVIEGLDVARKIYDVPLSPTAGSGVLKGPCAASCCLRPRLHRPNRRIRRASEFTDSGRLSNRSPPRPRHRRRRRESCPASSSRPAQ
jgi:peptidyl-prolyl cis-trans isomerase A (cyclophilin A)